MTRQWLVDLIKQKKLVCHDDEDKNGCDISAKTCEKMNNCNGNGDCNNEGFCECNKGYFGADCSIQP